MSERKIGKRVTSDDLSNSQWVESCWSDMQRRWSQQERVFVEDYLPSNGTIDPEAITDLVYAEYILRKEHGENPNHEEYVQRFPELKAGLLRQFALDDAFSSDAFYEFDSTLASDSDSARPSDEPVPERIGKYIVVNRIGSGGQAEVYRAIHPGLNREVVLKLGKTGTGLAAAQRQNLEAEARILASIEHPHLARIYDFDFFEDRPLLVMECIRGKTLEQYSRQENPPPTDCARLTAKIARGLAVVHQQGIVHLDIKPSNVLVGEDEEPRVIDFGLALLCDTWQGNDIAAGSVRGTLHFMSPEQANADTGLIDSRSDVFALGGLLFFLLTKSAPYPKCGFSELLERARCCDWQRELLYRRTIPAKLRDICLRAMDEDPDKRFSSAGAFAKELERVHRGRFQFVPLAIAAAIVPVALLLLIGFNSNWFARPDPGPHEPPIPVVPNTTIEQGFQPSLAIEVRESGRYLRLPNVAPLHNGDELRIISKVPAGMYYSIFLLTSEGTLKELYQAQPSSRLMTVQYPGQGQTAPLIGPPGTEVVLVCGRGSNPMRLDELRRLWNHANRWPTLPELSVLRMNSEGVFFEQQGRDLGPPLDRPDPESVVYGQLERLRESLLGRTAFFEAIAFSHQP